MDDRGPIAHDFEVVHLAEPPTDRVQDLHGERPVAGNMEPGVAAVDAYRLLRILPPQIAEREVRRVVLPDLPETGDPMTAVRWIARLDEHVQKVA